MPDFSSVGGVFQSHSYHINQSNDNAVFEKSHLKITLVDNWSRLNLVYTGFIPCKPESWGVCPKSKR